MNKFSERLKKLRAEQGFSLTELAKKTGYGKATVKAWETGERKPKNIIPLIIFADLFNVSTDYLIGLKN